LSVTILIGDVFARLAELPDNSVDIVVTSPPYWGLRDYGTATWEGGDPACDHRSPTMRKGRDEQRAALAGSAATNSAQLLLAHRSACGKCGAVKVDAQIGLEPTLGQHLDVMVAVFEEVRRVLKPTGTCWVNYGDCYATSPNGRSAADTKATGNDDRTFRDKPFSTIGPIYDAEASTGGYRGGDRNAHNPTGRVKAGGLLKAKDLCMVPNRLAIALQEAGWWVRSEIIWAKPNPMPESIKDRPASAHEKIFLLTKSARYFYAPAEVRQGRTSDEDANTFRGGSYVGGKPGPRAVTRNKRVGRANADSFARVSKNTSGEHGQKPQHRPERDEVAYLRGNGRNLRNYEPAPMQVWEIATASFSEAHFATFPPELVKRCLQAGCPKSGVVLDPFGGAGTTALVANDLGLDAIVIELSEDYAAMASRRLKAGLAIVVGGGDASRGLDPLPLFADRAGEAA
jgi:DNA modification methylase